MPRGVSPGCHDRIFFEQLPQDSSGPHQSHPHGGLGTILLSGKVFNFVAEEVTFFQKFTIRVAALIEQMVHIDGDEAYSWRYGKLPYFLPLTIPATLSSVEIQGDAVDPGKGFFTVPDLSAAFPAPNPAGPVKHAETNIRAGILARVRGMKGRYRRKPGLLDPDDQGGEEAGTRAQ